MNNLLSCEYEIDGVLFSMHMVGTFEEVATHADMLGLSEPEKAEMVIDYDYQKTLLSYNSVVESKSGYKKYCPESANYEKYSY